MDNTLFDFVHAKLAACKAVVNYLGIKSEKEELELLGYFVKGGKGIENLENIADYLKDKNIYEQRRFEKCSEKYTKTKIENIILYEGVIETLEKLKDLGLKIAVVTDADKDNAKARLTKTDLLQYFDVVVSIEITGKKKPEPDSILFALNELGVKPEETILVGDSLRRDIEPGTRLGMITVYAAYGDRNYFEEKRGKATYLINNISDLVDIVKNV